MDVSGLSVEGRRHVRPEPSSGERSGRWSPSGVATATTLILSVNMIVKLFAACRTL